MTPLPGSGAAVLRGGASPEHLAGHRTAIVDLVNSIRESIPKQMADQEVPRLRQYLFADAPSTITILGERGSGKTTLMFAVCGDLMRAENDLVLPPLHPELFSSNETVISAFLASLWAIFVDYEEDEQREALGSIEVDSDLIRILGDSARSYAASRTSREALAHATESTLDFAEDAVAISRSSARLPWQVGELARRICQPAEGPPRLMIVPIDDPDLAPDNVRTILRDLRVLGSIPGVVPIASFCRTDLTEAWKQGHLDGGNQSRRAILYERETEKLFPYRSRFEIQPFTANERVCFAPIGETKSLREKLHDLESVIGGEPFAEALTQIEPSYQLPNPLPENPRTLVQLWTTLDQVNPAHGEVTHAVAGHVLGTLCDLLSEPLRKKMTLDAGESFYKIGPPTREPASERTEIEINLKGIEIYGRYLATLVNAEEREVAHLGLRRLTGLAAARPTSGTPDAGHEELSAATSSSLLAFQQIVYGSNRFKILGGGTRFDRNDWTGGQEVTLAGMATDDYFLALPEARTLSEVVEVGEAWDGLVELAEQHASIDEILRAAVVASLGVLNEGPNQPSGSYEEAFEVATEVYEKANAREDRAGDRFRSWYEFDLPMQWHSALLDRETLRHCLPIFLDATTDAFKRDRNSRQKSPGALMDLRLSRILGVIADDADRARHCWIAGYFEVAAEFGSNHLKELAELTPFWRDRTTSLRAGSRIAGQALLHSQAHHDFAPYPSPEGHDLYFRARDMLRRRRTSAIRESGLGPSR